MQVLIVDDEANAVRLIKNGIAWDKFDIEECHTAFCMEDAIKIIENQNKKSVISNIQIMAR